METAPPQAPLISLAEIDGLISQANKEQWPAFGLMTLHARRDFERYLAGRGWRIRSIFRLREPATPSLLENLSRLTRVTSLGLWGLQIGAEGARAIADRLSGLTSLDLRGNQIGAEGARAIAEHLSGLTSLDLGGNQIGAEGARAIAEHLSGLTSLDLGDNRIGAEGARAIADRLSGLTSLDLGNNQIGDEGARAIADRLSGLTSLSLWNNQIGDEGARAIAEHLSGLTSLNLGGNPIGAEGARAIAERLSGLTSLNLGDNQIGDEGARAIAEHLSGLTSLDLWNNQIGDEGARAIAEHLSGLTSLDMGVNQIGAEGARAIAEHLSGLTSLNLGGNPIGDEGARAIAERLRGLTSLNLWNNHIGDEGARAIAEHLSGLTSLRLGDNHIGTEGARAIAEHLSGLTSLRLGDNHIGDEGARAIAERLSGLTSLNLRGNQIGDEGARAIAERLSGLTSLDMGVNQIGAEGARAIAERLSGLTSLDMGVNQIGAEGARAILDAWVARPGAQEIRGLDLRDNGDLSSILPAEVLETSDVQAILAAYRTYNTAKKRDELRPLNEAKLVVVGDEAVGKTSLIRFLIQGEARNPSEPKTPGTELHEKIETETWVPEASPFQLNVWDFGGQETMRGTHRFFLTARTLYLLVLENRLEDDAPKVHEWLKTIRNRGQDSPVIIAANKCDDGRPYVRKDDEDGLRQAYPNIVDFIQTSCDDDNHSRQAIQRLQQMIVQSIASDPRMKHVHDPIPKAWLRVKDAISKLSSERSILPLNDFQSLCADASEDEDRITDPNVRRALLRLLHDLGTVVAHGLERDAPAVRREITLLDPNWLTKAIYPVLERASFADQGGEFSREQLKQWLDPVDYPPERHEYILDLMQDPDIGLAAELPHSNGERFLVPQALPAKTPFIGKWPEDCIRFRYRYDFLPGNVFPRFIVEAHSDLAEPPRRWRTGAVLDIEGCPVLVTADLGTRKIDIAVDGRGGRGLIALTVVRRHLKSVHERNPEIKPEARVPLKDEPQLDVSYDHLVRLQTEEGPDYPLYPEHAARKHKVRELLEGVHSDVPLAADRRSAGRNDGQAEVGPSPVPVESQPQMPAGLSEPPSGAQAWEKPTLAAVGIGFLLALAGIAVLYPDPSDFQLRVFQVILALGAAAFGALLPGTLGVEHKGIKAAGALALFVVVYLFNPATLVTEPGASGVEATTPE